MDHETFHDFRGGVWKKPLVRAEKGRWRISGGSVRTIPALIHAPLVTGIPVQGQQLTSDVGFWTQVPSLLHGPPIMNEATVLNPEGLSYEQLGGCLTNEDGDPLYASFFQWQWLRNGSAILGGVGPYYTLTSSDVGHTISVEVLASNIIGVSPPGFSRSIGPIAASLSISGTPVTSATHNTPYTGFTVSASGGSGHYTYNVISGVWPKGIAMIGTGVVSGTPTQTGNFPITIQATDSYGLTANLAPFTLTVS